MSSARIEQIESFLKRVNKINHTKLYNNSEKENKIYDTLRNDNNWLMTAPISESKRDSLLTEISRARESFKSGMKSSRISISTAAALASRSRAEKGSKKTNAERASHRASVKTRRNSLHARVTARAYLKELHKEMNARGMKHRTMPSSKKTRRKMSSVNEEE